MKFSVVTPSYNQAEYIEQTIVSVLEQRKGNIEYIIVDGGSVDDSVSIINKYSTRVDKIIVEPDDGQADAINKGFRYASGDIFAYLNSDDYYFKDTIEKVEAAFKQNPDIDVVYGDCVFTDKTGQFLQYFSSISDFDKGRLLNNTDHIMQPATFWRREAFEKFGPFDKDLHFGFDWAFWCELASKNCNFLRIDEVVAANRVYGTTKTASGSDERLAELKKINKKYKTKFLTHAYYCFSFAEYLFKKNKSLIDYFKILFYFLFSFQNAFHYVNNYKAKIIHGVLPKTDKLLKEANIRLPRLSYHKLNISLKAPEYIDQSVSVYLNDGFIGDYSFVTGQIDIKLDLAAESDVDVKFIFTKEFKYMDNFLKRIIFFYKPRYISAVLCKFCMS